jgi:uncharacterized protein
LSQHASPAFAEPSGTRIEAIDVARGAALFGVLTVNLITAFRVSIFTQFLPATDAPGPWDVLVELLVTFALESKAFALFSLLFGVGLAIQFERLADTGRTDYFLVRRLLALLAFGVLHLVFIWNGDILTEYALAGFVALPFLRWPPVMLAKAAAFFLVLFLGLAIFPHPVKLPDPATLQLHAEEATRVYSSGTYSEILAFSVRELRLMLPLHLNVFPRTVGLILLGACIWKSGVLLRRPRIGWAAWGLGGTLLGFALTVLDERILSGMVAPVILALGYGALTYAVATTPLFARLLRPIAALGRMAFTSYILQSVVLSFVFFAFGLGQFGKVGAAQGLAMACALYALQAMLSLVWLRYFRFGPLEWLWRVLMYGRLFPNGPAPHTGTAVRTFDSGRSMEQATPSGQKRRSARASSEN